MSSPEEIERQIEQTRSALSGDVDRLSEKVSPGKAVGRRVENVKTGAASVRDRVMGSRDDNSGLRGAGGSVSSATSTVTDAASSAPSAVRRQTQGNPLAAGLIAFGVGWLLSSLAPASQPEQQLAEKAESTARDNLAEPMKAKGQEMAENLKEPVKQSAEQVKSSATDAVQETKDQARSAADDVKEPLQR
jgi:uncharacterized protein YjbJ (UPF0337 family)